MSDLISRQDAIDAIEDADMQVYYRGAAIGVRTHLTKEEIVAIIERVQPAEPKRKKGKWLEKEVCSTRKARITEFQSAKCSVCGKYHTTPYLYYFGSYNFCPYCGADMRGEDGKA